jgi:hypothetical protein
MTDEFAPVYAATVRPRLPASALMPNASVSMLADACRYCWLYESFEGVAEW